MFYDLQKCCNKVLFIVSDWCLKMFNLRHFPVKVTGKPDVVISQTISWVSQMRLATVAPISIFIE